MLAEGVCRGVLMAGTKEREQELREAAAGLRGKKGEDLLLRNTIVSRAPNDDLQLAYTLAWRRSEILRWIRARLMAEQPLPDQLMMFYPPNLSRELSEPETELATPPTTTAAAPESSE